MRRCCGKTLHPTTTHRAGCSATSRTYPRRSSRPPVACMRPTRRVTTYASSSISSRSSGAPSPSHALSVGSSSSLRSCAPWTRRGMPSTGAAPSRARRAGRSRFGTARSTTCSSRRCSTSSARFASPCSPRRASLPPLVHSLCACPCSPLRASLPPTRPASAHARAHHVARACKCAHHGGTALLYPTGA